MYRPSGLCRDVLLALPSVGPPGFRLPLVASRVRYRYNLPPSLVEEPGVSHEPWEWWRERDD